MALLISIFIRQLKKKYYSMRERLLRTGLILLAQTLFFLQTAQEIHSTRSEAESESDSLLLRRVKRL